jgi:two-component system response regulator HydG
MSSSAKPRVLIADDDPDLTALLAAGLAAMEFEPHVVSTGDAAYAALSAEDFDLVLTDLNMPGLNGLEFCERAVANRPDVPVVVMTAFASVETAVSALRVGAEDFVTKPVQVEALGLRLQRLLRARELRHEVVRLREEVRQARRFDEIVGQSAAMTKVFELVDRVCDSDASVLISGESGTGKEVVARALHSRGHRAAGPFVAVNCSAVPEHLLESELFGHAKGSFTDAIVDRIGLFQRASGGTLFLDEIGEMPLALQPKILRALQERAVRPVGADREVPIDVRVIAATNRDLESAVEERRFREDLYFRINVICVDLPPLRARGKDVLLLCQHFLTRFARQAGKPIKGLSPAAADKLLAYAWPGNVRELQNCMERAVALARFEEIAVDDLPEKIRDFKSSHVLIAASDPTELVPMEEVERRYVARVMEAVGGNKTMAARVLGFDRKTLYRKLERYGIQVEASS